MPDAPPRMVCFDAGGVLVRICRTWQERCQRANVEYRWNDEAERGKTARHEIYTAHESGRMDHDTYCARIASTTAGLYSPEQVRAIHLAWIIDEYPGVRSLVHTLQQLPTITTALLSNTNAVHWQTPHMMGRNGSAVRAIETPHASHLLGHTKPGTEIYRAFERETGFAADDILFFDDTAENIHTARALGWRAEHIDHTKDTAAQLARHLAAHGIDLPHPQPPKPYTPPA
ncbi:MAG: HAD-IA family hydrolase [Planctomycetota bacterium]|nr:HAD-IA family hydrolase [Planctomycetota bacterium]